MPVYQTLNDLAPTPGYSHVAVLGPEESVVVTAGAVPIDPEGRLVGEGDFIAQTEQVLANLETALRAAGASLAHVVKSTVYVVAERREDLSTVWDVVRASRLSDGPHTSTLLGVGLLGYSGQLVEIEAIAVTG